MRRDRKSAWLIRQAVRSLAQPRQSTRVVAAPNATGTGFSVAPRSPGWLVFYNGTVLPHDDPVHWTKSESGAVAYAAAGGILTVTDDSDAEHVSWYIQEASLTNDPGAQLEAWVRVTAGSAVADEGAHLCVWDGTEQFLVFLRETGLNVYGSADVAIDLSGWHRVTMLTRGAVCEVRVDDNLVQVGATAGGSAYQRFGFGSGLVDQGQSVADWDWVGGAVNWA